MIRSFLRKDRVVLLLQAIIGTFIVGYPFFDGASRAWEWPSSDYLYSHAYPLWVICGTLLGFELAAFESIDPFFGSEDYVDHRAVSRARRFWIRVLSGVLVMLPWVVVPIAWSLADVITHGGLLELAMLRLAENLFVHVALLSSFAAGLFAGSWPARLQVRALAAVACGAGLSPLYFLGEPALGDTAASLGRYVAVHVAVAALFVAAASVPYRDRPDADRPVPRHSLVAASIGGAVIVALLGSWFAFEWQRDSIARAWIGQRVSMGDEEWAIERLGGSRVAWRRPSDPREDADRFTPWAADAAPFVDSGVDFARPRAHELFEAVGPRFQTSTVEIATFRSNPFDQTRYTLHPAEGKVLKRGFHWAGGSFRSTIRWIGKGPNGAQFSSDAVVLDPPDDLEDEQRTIVIADPTDTRVWMYRPADRAEHFVELVLPDSDELVGVERGAPGSVTRVVGQRGEYRWNGATFEPAPVRDDRDASPRLEIVEHDPLRPTVRIHASDGRVATHRFEQNSLRQRLGAAGTYALSAFRPPAVLAANSLTGTARGVIGRGIERLYVAPLFAGGKRRAVLAAVVGVFTVVGLFAAWRLRCLGGSRRRAFGWAALIAASGVGGLVVYWILETKRAYGPRESFEPVEPLLRSAGRSPENARSTAIQSDSATVACAGERRNPE